MTDEEWSRICKRASWTHGLAMTALIMIPCAVWALAPEFVAQFEAVLSSSPYGEGIEAAIGYAWLICLIGCFFPPRRIFGRGFWAVLTVGWFAAIYWACATDKINADGELVALGELGSSVFQPLICLLLCVFVAGIIFDGPKSWERRYSQSSTGEIARR
ncbi:MAG: hypothetical protein LUE89_11185 [Clostridiales bacterium]|nr:hypothetical protein [Clostridiales bacterium]